MKTAVVQYARVKNSGARTAILAAAVLAAIALESGCTPHAGSADQLSLSGSPVAPLPFAEILRKIPQFSREELIAQLQSVHSAGNTTQRIQQESAYALGRALQHNGSAEEQKQAIQLFQEAANLAPLWERCQWHISECAAAAGQEKTVRQALESIRDRSEIMLSRAGAEYGLAQSYLRGNESQRAREAFENVIARYPKTQFALGSDYYVGEMDLAGGKRSQALPRLRAYLRLSPDGHFAQEIVGRLTSLKGYEPTSQDRNLFGQVYYVQGEWQPALTQFMKSNSDTHWYESAVCLYRLGKAPAAQTRLAAGIKSHPEDNNIPAAAQMLCQTLNKDQCVQIWKNIERAARTKYGDAALWHMALRSGPPQSLVYYRQIVEQFPHSDYAPESAWWLIWDQIKNGKDQEAIKSLEAAQKQYSHARAASRFAFWEGKLYERMKKPQLAKAAYSKAAGRSPAHYYGYRSEARLAALGGGHDPGWATAASAVHPDPNWSWPELDECMSSHEMEQECGSTVSILAQLRQWDECMQLLPQKAGAVLKSWVMANLGLPLDAINAASAGLSGTPKKNGRWQLAYPLLYGNVIAAEAKERNVDPLLVHALVREESKYNQLALSHSNALGLMQLLPGTAYGVAKHLGVVLSGNSDIYKPEINLKLGTQYLAYTANRFAGNALFAIASYNGGPNAVQSWARSSSDPDAFVENIPFQETRDYVRKVFGSYWTYKKIYAASGSSKENT